MRINRANINCIDVDGISNIDSLNNTTKLKNKHAIQPIYMRNIETFLV